jgi:hypothetical protein
VDISFHGKHDLLVDKYIFYQILLEAMGNFTISIGPDLEAFSLSRAGDSFAALIVQSAALPII